MILVAKPTAKAAGARLFAASSVAVGDTCLQVGCNKNDVQAGVSFGGAPANTDMINWLAVILVSVYSHSADVSVWWKGEKDETV